MLRHANAVLRDAGLEACRLDLARDPTDMPLIGAARSAPPRSPAAVVLDFGQTSVKRGVARYDLGTLTELVVLPVRPARGTAPPVAAEGRESRANRLAERIVDQVVRVWWYPGAAGLPAPDAVCLGLASYVRNGQPVFRPNAAYAELGSITPHLTPWLEERLEHRLGRSVEVTILHDGTAAARALAGDAAAEAAVLTLGSAVGVGFVPSAASVRPVAPAFEVRPLRRP